VTSQVTGDSCDRPTGATLDLVTTLAPTRARPVLDGLGEPGPHWFTWVMGTGIVAAAGATLPADLPALVTAARVVWSVAAVLLVVVAVVVLRSGRMLDPATTPFLGAGAMALMTVGAGAVLLGTAPAYAAVPVWAAGLLAGLATAVVVPVRGLPGPPTPVWLLPVVPPVVGAATGPVVVPALAPLWALLLTVALAGAALTAGRVVGHPTPTPLLWIPLGPLGQGATAAHSTGLGPVVALPLWAGALAWLVFVAVRTARALRVGLPFALTWWSFTFPLGTVVTATSGLAADTGVAAFTALAVVLYTGLVAVWGIVAVGTVRLALQRGPVEES
jgi:tellurite resistance protein TehA-like permease